MTKIEELEQKAKMIMEAKPILIHMEEDREYIDYDCPHCKATLQQKMKGAKRTTIFMYKHCYLCGQKLDWEGVINND